MKKYKSHNKKDANYKLEKSQLIELNKEFYENFHINYYTVKLNTIMNILANTSDYRDYIDQKYICYEKFEANINEVEEDELCKFAKIELNTMYFHCAENFIRLFIAHGRDTHCPWLEMCNLDIHLYRKCLKNISKGNFSYINKNMNEEELIMYVFTGHKESIEKVGINKEDYENIKDWIIWIAHELLENAQYNAYKHGMAIYPSSNKISISGRGKQIKAEGEILRYLKKKEKDDRFVWTKEEKYISYDSIIAIIFTINELSKSILNIGKYIYVPNQQYKIGRLPSKEINVNSLTESKNNNDFGLVIKSLSQELVYYK